MIVDLPAFDSEAEPLKDPLVAEQMRHAHYNYLVRQLYKKVGRGGVLVQPPKPFKPKK